MTPSAAGSDGTNLVFTPSDRDRVYLTFADNQAKIAATCPSFAPYLLSRVTFTFCFSLQWYAAVLLTQTSCQPFCTGFSCYLTGLPVSYLSACLLACTDSARGAQQNPLETHTAPFYHTLRLRKAMENLTLPQHRSRNLVHNSFTCRRRCLASTQLSSSLPWTFVAASPVVCNTASLN